MSMKLTLAGTIVLGLVLIGCGDDDGAVDSGLRDAATMPDAAMDAAMADGGDADGGDTDGGDTDGGDTDGGDTDGGDTDGGGEEFTATLALNYLEEVPLCTGASVTAMGTGTVTLDAANTMIEVEITYSALSGPATGAHIHTAPPGMAGPIVLPFTDLTSPIMETFTEADYPATPPAGAPADWDAFVALMRSGGTYVNIHTAACAPGEIRDQIVD